MKVSEITSAANPKFKVLARLCDKSRSRKETGLFPVEGFRELSHCVEGGFEIDSIFFKAGSDISLLHQLESLFSRCSSGGTGASLPYVYALAPNLFSRIAYREGTESFVALAREKRLCLEEIKLSENPFLLVLESVEKPGNLGALLRSADACGVDAVLVCDPLTDLYNPNLIRASIGGVFTKQIVACTSQEACKFLKDRNIRIFTAQLQDSEWYYECDFRSPSAIVMGSEANGLTSFWRDASDARIKIPMLGKLDSLNVSVSAAVLCYEVVRQRFCK